MVAAHIALYGDDETYAIVLSNVQSGMVQRLATDLHSFLFGDGVVSAPPDLRPVDMSAAKLASLEGDFFLRAHPSSPSRSSGEWAAHFSLGRQSL